MEKIAKETIAPEFIEYMKSKSATIFFDKKRGYVLCQSTKEYIPIDEFKSVFGNIGELVKKEKIVKFIFDKRSLTVFHQPSMEWYYVEWKPEMYKHGLKIHRKILPGDYIFRESVKIGREKINKEHPDNITTLIDLKYFETLEEAIAH